MVGLEGWAEPLLDNAEGAERHQHDVSKNRAQKFVQDPAVEGAIDSDPRSHTYV